ncbi:MAG: hypothetical protein AAGB11_17985 [Pseudomonadota bacterium]
MAAFTALAAAISSGLGFVDMARWAATQQRAFHDLFTQLMGMNGGGFLAGTALIGASFAYGFLHAAVPGHGKFLIAGAGLSSRIGAFRLVGISLLASLTQAVTGIVLVYGSFSLLDITAGWAMSATNNILIPASYAAIAVIALILIRRSLVGFSRIWAAPDDTGHSHDGSCNHRHGPSIEETDAIRSWRDAAMLVLGIGLRPCTGAVFVLVAAWRMNLLVVGAVAAFAMAIGTGMLISLVALSATSARGATLMAAGAQYARVLVPVLQFIAGVTILLVALAFLIAPFTPL